MRGKVKLADVWLTKEFNKLQAIDLHSARNHLTDLESLALVLHKWRQDSIYY